MSYCSIGSRAKAKASSRQASSLNPARTMLMATLFLGACLSAPLQGWGEEGAT
jgi:hypothetical protein